MSVKRKSPDENASGPLESQQYLVSPIGTLLESLQDPQAEYITLRDLAQAYATLSRRIRLQAATILLNDRIYPALTILRTHNASISTCLLRDIGRCLLSPLNQLTHPEPATLTAEVGKAQAFATLSQHALVFLSDVFSLTPIMNNFSAKQLQDLLKGLLIIISNPTLPTPSPRKTWSLAVWVLISQHLTEDVLVSRKKEIKDCLLQMVQGGFGEGSPRVDGLKLFSALFQPSTETFHFSVLPLYPSILRSLTKDNLDIQLQALKAIMSIVEQKLHSPTKDWTKVTTQTRAYVVGQLAKHKASQQCSLQSVLSSAIKDQGDKWGHKGPLWALLLTGCLICLSDKDIFTHPHSLKLLLTVLGKATNHQIPHIRALHPHIWNCLIWCYSRLPLTQELQDGQKLTDVRQRAFLVLRQDLKGGVATALVAALCHPVSKSEPSTMSGVISSILDVIKSLLSRSRANQLKEAIYIQNRLISGISATPIRSVPVVEGLSSFISAGLLTGSLLDLQEEAIKGAINRLARPALSLIPTLPEKLVFQRWDAFIDVWIRGMKCTLELEDEAITFWDELLNIWQTLLLVRSQIVYDSTRLTISSQTCDRVKAIITGFVPATDDVQKQFRQLRAVERLWSVVKQSYEHTTLVPLAENILSAVLAQVYALQIDEVKIAWGKLCSKLMVVVQPSFLYTTFSRNPLQERVEVQRQLWVTMAKSDIFTDRKGHEIVEFLCIPLSVWELDSDELEIWTRLFEGATDFARPYMPNILVQLLLKSLGKLDDIVSENLISFLPVILRRVTFKDNDASYGDFLALVNVILLQLYPPVPEDHARALAILEGVGHLVGSTNKEHITTLLCSLQDGLCVWIRDELTALLESEHTVVIRDIYGAALATLTKAPPSLERLQDLSPFFAAGFERIGHPANGPCAFAQFWRSTYHTQHALKQMIPEDLRVCLKAWSDHCEDSLGDGIPSITDSQSTSKSIISDSQLSPVKIVPDSDPMDAYDVFSSLMIPSDGFGLDLEEVPNAASTPKAGTLEVTTPKASARESQPLHIDVVQPSISSKINSNTKATNNPGNKRVRVEDEHHPSPKRVRTVGDIQNTSVRPTETETDPQRVASGSISINNSSTPSTKTKAGPTVLPFPLPVNINTISFRTPQRGRHRRKTIGPSAPHARQGEEEIIPETSSPLPFSPIPIAEKGKEKEKGKQREEKAMIGLGKRKAIDFDDIIEDSTEIDPFSSPLNPVSDNNRNLHHSKPSPAKRLHSEPMLLHSPTKPPPLRRTHTSSSTSSRLSALEHAYQLLAQAESQDLDDELPEAANIVQRLSAKVNEQMTKKLRKRK